MSCVEDQVRWMGGSWRIAKALSLPKVLKDVLWHPTWQVFRSRSDGLVELVGLGHLATVTFDMYVWDGPSSAAHCCSMLSDLAVCPDPMGRKPGIRRRPVVFRPGLQKRHVLWCSVKRVICCLTTNYNESCIWREICLVVLTKIEPTNVKQTVENDHAVRVEWGSRLSEATCMEQSI